MCISVKYVAVWGEACRGGLLLTCILEVTGSSNCQDSFSYEDLYFSRNVVKIVESRLIRLVDYVLCMREMINTYKMLTRNPEENFTSEA
jgi:hypothetical protein